jgi:glycosyltransferase involved in cell wall biosynthesis
LSSQSESLASPQLPPAASAAQSPSLRKQRVLFFVEGFTDIRFVEGLSRICDLTMVVPERQYLSSGLRGRVGELLPPLTVRQISGRRLAFQLRSLVALWRCAGDFDLILAQEALRGALNANLVGKLRRVPVVTYVGISPLEYFRCRRERGQLGRLSSALGEAVIHALLRINGRMAMRCLAMGPYLREVAARYCPRTETGLYYGVNTRLFRPAAAAQRAALRRLLGLPRDKFLVLLSSRISHEKDPETVLRAVSIARDQGLDAVLLNLGGGWRDFLALARTLGLPEPDRWVMARPAANPMTEVFDYFRAADAVAMASLAEGAAYSTLEALACGIPVVATAVGGMAVQLRGHARLVPRRDSPAMARELLWVAANPTSARAQALEGRAYVVREWDSGRAFADLKRTLAQVAAAGCP